MFDNMPQVNVSQTHFVKRRRLITTEMAKSRLAMGDWELRAVPGASVRCRFFYELFDGNIPLNTLSCKFCGATYSVQSRSHYREHVRRRHSEVYCVRNSRSNHNVATLPDTDAALAANSALFSADDSLNADSPFGADYLDGEGEFDDEEDDIDGGFSLPFNNDSSLAGTEGEDDCLDEEEGSGSPDNGDYSGLLDIGLKSEDQKMPQLNANGKVRRIVTTDTATVLSHLDAGDWQKRAIPGISIRSRFFVEIVEGEKALNILLCKVCGSTYSAQSRSHCVEHVKKRHQSYLNGHADDPDLEYDIWKDTRRPSPSALQKLPVPYTLAGNSNSNSAGPSSSSRTPLSGKLNLSVVRPKTESPAATYGPRKRKRFPNEIVTGPDQTIETPSFEDVLQSIASQVLLNGDDEDLKFNLDDFNKSLQSDDGILNDESTDKSSKKRRIADADATATTSRDDTASPPLLSGGINDQLFALSELGLAEAEQQRKAKEIATNAEAESAEKPEKLQEKNASSATKSLTLLNGTRTKFSQHSLSVQRKQSRNNVASSSPAQENGIGKANETIKMISAAKKPMAASSGQKLNHQQLLMASRTAALLSGNGDDTGSDGDLSPKENGPLSPSNVRVNGRDKDYYGNSSNGGYYPPFSNGARNDQTSYTCSRQHLYANSLHSGGSSGGFHKSNPPTSWVHRREMMQSHHQPNFTHNASPDSRAYDGEFTAVNNISNNHIHNTSNGLLKSGEDPAFCRTCKSEFPNVVKGLNQLYGCVKDLTDVVRVALSHPVAADTLRNSPNLGRALRRLDASSRASSAVVQNFSAITSNCDVPNGDRSKKMISSKRPDNSMQGEVARVSPAAKRITKHLESAPSLQRMDYDANTATETTPNNVNAEHQLDNEGQSAPVIPGDVEVIDTVQEDQIDRTEKCGNAKSPLSVDENEELIGETRDNK